MIIHLISYHISEIYKLKKSVLLSTASTWCRIILNCSPMQIHTDTHCTAPKLFFIILGFQHMCNLIISTHNKISRCGCEPLGWFNYRNNRSTKLQTCKWTHMLATFFKLLLKRLRIGEAYVICTVVRIVLVYITHLESRQVSSRSSHNLWSETALPRWLAVEIRRNA